MTDKKIQTMPITEIGRKKFFFKRTLMAKLTFVSVFSTAVKPGQDQDKPGRPGHGDVQGSNPGNG